MALMASKHYSSGLASILEVIFNLEATFEYCNMVTISQIVYWLVQQTK